MTTEVDLGRISIAHQRIERWMMRFMAIGLLAMFQPWFRSIASWFNGLTDSGDASTIYREDIAPFVFRYGFFVLLASTLGFIIVGHFTPLMMQESFVTKGKALTYWLIFLPLGYGLMLIGSLAYGYGGGALMGLIGAVAAIAAWNWKPWGVVAIGLIGVLAIVNFIAGGFTWLGAAAAAVFAGVTIALVASRWDGFRRSEDEPAPIGPEVVDP